MGCAPHGRILLFTFEVSIYQYLFAHCFYIYFFYTLFLIISPDGFYLL